MSQSLNKDKNLIKVSITGTLLFFQRSRVLSKSKIPHPLPSRYYQGFLQTTWKDFFFNFRVNNKSERVIFEMQ